MIYGRVFCANWRRQNRRRMIPRTSELLVEYQKAYDLVPDPKIGARIEQLKARIKAK